MHEIVPGPTSHSNLRLNFKNTLKIILELDFAMAEDEYETRKFDMLASSRSAT